MCPLQQLLVAGHRGNVYTVDYARDGKRFASGGADNTIFIWTSEAEGLLKYTHTDSIQKLAYNPVTGQLASCTESDFGLWSPQQKNVQKHKVPSKVLSASWTADGQYLALGMLNGLISIRDKSGDEKVRTAMRCRARAPLISCLTFFFLSPPFKGVRPSGRCLGILRRRNQWMCWQWGAGTKPCHSTRYARHSRPFSSCEPSLVAMQVTGIQHGKDRHLGFDPCSVSHFSNGEYLVVGGSDKKVKEFHGLQCADHLSHCDL